MNDKVVFKIDNTKPLDAIVLEKLIKELCNWKDKADYRLDSLKSNQPDKYADISNQIKVMLVYDEIDDIASLDTMRAINEIGYLNKIEKQIHHALLSINHNHLSTFNPAIISIYKFLIALFPTTTKQDNINSKATIITEPILHKELKATGNDKGTIRRVVKAIKSVN